MDKLVFSDVCAVDGTGSSVSNPLMQAVDNVLARVGVAAMGSPSSSSQQQYPVLHLMSPEQARQAVQQQQQQRNNYNNNNNAILAAQQRQSASSPLHAVHQSLEAAWARTSSSLSSPSSSSATSTSTSSSSTPRHGNQGNTTTSMWGLAPPPPGSPQAINSNIGGNRYGLIAPPHVPPQILNLMILQQQRRQYQQQQQQQQYLMHQHHHQQQQQQQFLANSTHTHQASPLRIDTLLPSTSNQSPPTNEENNKLREHAASIVQSLSSLSSTDERFQQSDFLNMMREIVVGDTTVQNETMVRHPVSSSATLSTSSMTPETSGYDSVATEYTTSNAAAVAEEDIITTSTAEKAQTEAEIDAYIRQQLFGGSASTGIGSIDPSELPLYGDTNNSHAEESDDGVDDNDGDESSAVEEVRKRLLAMEALWKRAVNGDNFDIDTEDLQSIITAAKDAVQAAEDGGLTSKQVDSIAMSGNSNSSGNGTSSNAAVASSVLQEFNAQWEIEKQRISQQQQGAGAPAHSIAVGDNSTHQGIPGDMMQALREEERIAAIIDEAWQSSGLGGRRGDEEGQSATTTTTFTPEAAEIAAALEANVRAYYDELERDESLLEEENNRPNSEAYILGDASTNIYASNTPTNAFEEGMRLFNAGELREAIQAFEGVLHQSPNHSEAWRLLGACHAEVDDDTNAIRCLEAAVETDPYNTAALLQLSVSYFNEMDRDRALQTLRAWIRHHPHYHALEVSHRLEQQQQQQQQQSISGAGGGGAAAVGTRKENTVYDNKNDNDGGGGGLYADGSEVDEVMDLLLRADAMHLSQNGVADPDISILLGVVYNVSRDYDAGAAAFQRALLLSSINHPPSTTTTTSTATTTTTTASSSSKLPREQVDYDTWNKLGASLSHKGDHPRALQAYARALAIRPTFARGWMNMGISYFSQEKYAEAARAYLRAAKLNPGAAHIWTLLRIAFTSMARVDLVTLTEAGDPNAFDGVEF